jgi:hypothetical protein
MTWNRWAKRMSILLIIAGGSLGRAEDANLFYYVCVPRCEPDMKFLSALCVRFAASSASTPGGQHGGRHAAEAWYTFWYLQPCFQAATATTEHPWGGTFEDFMERVRPEPKGMDKDLPVAITGLLTKVHAWREYTSQDIILQPLYARQSRSLWRAVDHLDVVAVAAPGISKERSRWLVRAINRAGEGARKVPALRDDDVAAALRQEFSRVGIKTQSVRYWQEYNILVIQADAGFEGLAVSVFSLASRGSLPAVSSGRPGLAFNPALKPANSCSR